MKLIKNNKYKNGFTLIELVIVVAIIGILGSMVVPRYTGLTDEATKKADLTSARTIASAVSIAITEVDQISQINNEHIERYLSNINVEVIHNGVNPSDNGWYVVFKNEDGDKENFTIYKDGKQIFPKSDEG